eukprot:sb/3467494/
MVDDLLEKKSKNKTAVPEKSQRQIETEELDYLLSHKKQAVEEGDEKIKPRNMKKSTAQPAKFNLKKHQKKDDFSIEDEEVEGEKITVKLEDLKPENIAEPAEEPEDFVAREEEKEQGDETDEDLYSPDEEEKDQAEEEDPDFEVKPKKISLIKRDDGKTKTLRDIKLERANRKKKEAEQAKQQLHIEDDLSDPLQSASFKRFSKLIEIIFEHEDEMVPENFKLVGKDEEEWEPSPETLLSLRKLELLSAEAAKLKQMKIMNCIPQDRLVRLLNILDRHIRDTIRLSLNPEPFINL